MAAYAYKEVCHRADFTAMEEQFQEKYGREIDGDANYDGDYWTVAADLLDAKDTRIADLEARLATAEGEVVRLRDAAEDLRFHLGCESVAKDGYLTECEAASAVIAYLRAKCEAAETKATISQITAETEKRLRESSERDAERECLWSSDGFNDLWESSCGMAWTFPDEGPKENDMTYCPKCRGVLIVEALTEGGEHET